MHPSPVALPDLDTTPAEEILAWAFRRFPGAIAVACSMQDAVVVDLALRLDPDVEVFFLDTGFHFPETYATATSIRRRYGIEPAVLRPDDGAARHDTEGTGACCADRKVAPLERYLATKRAWVSGLRRTDAPSRTGTRALEWDPRGLVKVNPLVAWTDEDVARYVTERDVVVNPLRQQGYDSIGCAPCTVPGSGREGRWAGSERTECGLHAASRAPAAALSGRG